MSVIINTLSWQIMLLQYLNVLCSDSEMNLKPVTRDSNRRFMPQLTITIYNFLDLGPLCYFSDHLLWLQDDRNAVIGDMNGQNAAVISGMSLSGLHMVAILDPALHQLPS